MSSHKRDNDNMMTYLSEEDNLIKIILTALALVQASTQNNYFYVKRGDRDNTYGRLWE